MQIKKATRKKQKARIGLFGPSGSGKTYSALLLASAITSFDKICVIDTERGSASLYNHLGDFNVLDLYPPFTPERYIEAINTAVKAGMEVIIIDSITHEWAGAGGILEIVDNSVGSNKFTSGWKDATPRHNAFIDAILGVNAHVICCGRTHQAYELVENEKGKKVPQKIGLKAVTREGFDYEMTLCFDIDIKHYASSSKDRTQLFDKKPSFLLGKETGEKILDWLNEGVDIFAINECRNIGEKIKQFMLENTVSSEQLYTIATADDINTAIDAGNTEFMIEVFEKLQAFKKEVGAII